MRLLCWLKYFVSMHSLVEQISELRLLASLFRFLVIKLSTCFVSAFLVHFATFIIVPDDFVPF